METNYRKLLTLSKTFEYNFKKKVIVFFLSILQIRLEKVLYIQDSVVLLISTPL